MAHEHEHAPAPAPHSHEAPPERGTSWTGYALVKYSVILIIVLAILWFVANYFLGE